MKITKFLVLSFVIFAFITTSFHKVVHAKDLIGVMDVFGNKVQVGTPYLIIAKDHEIFHNLIWNKTNEVNLEHLS